MNRRGFLGFLASAAVVAVTPLKFVAPALHERVIQKLTFHDLVTQTLRTHAPQIVANITQHNALLAHLIRNGDVIASVETIKVKLDYDV